MNSFQNIMKEFNISIYGIILLFIACGIIIFYAIYKYTEKTSNKNIKHIEKNDKIPIIENIPDKKEKKLIDNEDNELVLPKPDKYELNYGEETRGVSRMVNKPLTNIVPNNILSGNISFIPDYSNLAL